ncbi:hypothetical protein CCY99_07205 [Helicobacter sp. 16-1353]|uniref:ABC transporter permease n=1 Tax=Helicobacter sp. 16-1353 TaxID=2004996 RepID=UPI000DCE29F3|nr:ABC transporter permease [Helicobacter sp. 16-1353]RAX52746.1 hypothetical protein CCY99_07205 [Helicobacter sp. 16-1353]
MLEIIKIEITNILKDRFLLFMYIVMPLFVGIFMYSTISKSIISDTPIGIVDLDNTQTSRNIIFDINASQGINVKRYYSSITEAKDDLSVKNIYALVVFPHNFEFDLKRQITPSVGIYYNTQLVFIGKNIYGALNLVFKNEDVDLRFKRYIASSQNTSLALGKSIDFMPKIISLYNPNSNFSQFLLTAALPCSWQLFIILCMIALIAYDEKDVGFIKNKINKIESIYKHLGAKILINTIIFFIWWIIMTIAFYNLSYPSNGNIGILILNALVTILAYNSIGIFLYAIIGSHIRSISVAAFYAAPSLAFIGITYPLNSMELFPTFWSSILPITNYIQVYIQQQNYEIDAIYSLQLIMRNLPFLLFGILGFIIYKKKKPI